MIFEKNSLVNAVAEKCTFINRARVDDGYGGYKTTWTDGATFDAAISRDETTSGLTAQAQGVTAIYTVVTDKSLNLQFHEVFRRNSDGKVFRVTTKGDDNATPITSPMKLRSVRAEEWVIPIEESEA